MLFISKSAEFLISNMDIHQAVNYYWVDSSGCKIDFNEFSYQNFKESVASFRQIVEKKGQLTPVPFNSEDIKTIDAKYLINNIEVAIKSWKNSKIKNIPFQIFCEYILPYRVTIEPIEKWRENYQEEYKWITDSLFSLDLKTVMGLAQIDYKTSFHFTWNKESRDEPLPRLGAKHLIFRKKGACEDVAAMVAFIFRAQGIPTAYDKFNLLDQANRDAVANLVYAYNLRVCSAGTWTTIDPSQKRLYDQQIAVDQKPEILKKLDVAVQKEKESKMIKF